MILRPSEVYYSQDSICCYFDKRSSHNGVRIGDTLDDICTGRCRITDVPEISVMWDGSKWVTADNRRLWVFRELERLGKCQEIFVSQTYYIPDGKQTSSNGGESVVVRGNPGGIWHKKASMNTNSVPSYARQTTYSPTRLTDYSYRNGNQTVTNVYGTSYSSAVKKPANSYTTYANPYNERTIDYSYRNASSYSSVTNARPAPSDTTSSNSEWWCVIL